MFNNKYIRNLKIGNSPNSTGPVEQLSCNCEVNQDDGMLADLNNARISRAVQLSYAWVYW